MLRPIFDGSFLIENMDENEILQIFLKIIGNSPGKIDMTALYSRYLNNFYFYSDSKKYNYDYTKNLFKKILKRFRQDSSFLDDKGQFMYNNILEDSDNHKHEFFDFTYTDKYVPIENGVIKQNSFKIDRKILKLNIKEVYLNNKNIYFVIGDAFNNLRIEEKIENKETRGRKPSPKDYQNNLVNIFWLNRKEQLFKEKSQKVGTAFQKDLRFLILRLIRKKILVGTIEDNIEKFQGEYLNRISETRTGLIIKKSKYFYFDEIVEEKEKTLVVKNNFITAELEKDDLLKCRSMTKNSIGVLLIPHIKKTYYFEVKKEIDKNSKTFEYLKNNKLSLKNRYNYRFIPRERKLAIKKNLREDLKDVGNNNVFTQYDEDTLILNGNYLTFKDNFLDMMTEEYNLFFEQTYTLFENILNYKTYIVRFNMNSFSKKGRCYYSKQTFEGIKIRLDIPKKLIENIVKHNQYDQYEDYYFNANEYNTYEEPILVLKDYFDRRDKSNRFKIDEKYSFFRRLKNRIQNEINEEIANDNKEILDRVSPIYDSIL